MQFERISTDRCALGECPLWCDMRRVFWWVDVLEGALWSFDPAAGDCRRHPVQARRLGSIALYDDAGLLLACDDGLYRYDPDTGYQGFLTDPDPRGPAFRKNDGRVDPFGNFWVGTLREADFGPVGRIYRVSPSGSSRAEADGLAIPNGLAFDAARGWVYFADTRAYTIWRAPLSKDGGLDRREVFVTTQPPARPDGSCLDREGRLWSAIYAGGQIACYTPEGAQAMALDLPMTYPTCACFGGDDCAQLCITSASQPMHARDLANEPEAGHVILLNSDVKGRPEHRLQAPQGRMTPADFGERGVI